MKLEKKNLTLEQFLENLDLNDIGKSVVFSDLEDDDSGETDQISSRNVSPMLRPETPPPMSLLHKPSLELHPCQTETSVTIKREMNDE